MKDISSTVVWGIIGCGDVCEVKSGPAFSKVPNSKLAAVMRRDADKAADYARRHHVDRSYSDADALIADKEVNAIYIATPPSSHEGFLAAAAKAGKPVYVEKPVTLNSASCERMIATAKQYDVKVSVAHYRRRVPLFVRVNELIREGRIGDVRLVRLTTLQPKVSKIITQTSDNWRINPEVSGGGLFHDLSPHQLDIVYWLFGKPVSVRGNSINQSKAYNAPDVTTVEATFKNDILLQGLWAFNVSEGGAQDYCEIIGSKGSLKFSFFRKSTIEVVTDQGNETLEPYYHDNIQHPMIEDVVRYFRGEGANPCSLEDALVVMGIMDKTNQ